MEITDKTKEQLIEESAALRQKIIELENEKTERRRSEEELKKTKHELEERVKERTAELETAVKLLQDEIKEHKKTEKRLLYFQKAIDSSSDAIGMSTPEGRHYYQNEIFTKLFGLNINEVDGETGPPSTVYADEKIGREVFETIKRGDSWIGEVEMLDKSQCKLTVFLRAYSIKDEKDNVIGLVGMHTDITQHKEIENALRNSEEKYRTLFENSPLGIAHINNSGVLTTFNENACKILGTPKENLVGFDALKMLKDENLRSAVVSALSGNSSYYEGDYLSVTGNKLASIKVNLGPLISLNGFVDGAIVIIENISERKKAEMQLIASLKEKDVLLQEIHHRVKNNMQVISSLMSLQKNHIKDKDSIVMLTETQNRIKSMSLIHEKLYKSKDLGKINFIKYIDELSQGLFQFYEIDTDRITLKINGKDVFFGIDTAIPCGLIINELISNSLKHAFPYDREGNVRITLNPVNSEGFKLVISDNGIGMPEDLDIKNTESLGLKLIVVLVRQINGNIKCNRTNGTEFIIKFQQKCK